VFFYQAEVCIRDRNVTGVQPCALPICDLLVNIEGTHIVIMIAVVSLLILFLTEFTSNTATATMILPVLAGLAMAVDVHPLALMLPAAMAANCAFMLPVGTPPNAIVFGTGKISIQEMAKAGFGLRSEEHTS